MDTTLPPTPTWDLTTWSDTLRFTMNGHQAHGASDYRQSIQEVSKSSLDGGRYRKSRRLNDHDDHDRGRRAVHWADQSARSSRDVDSIMAEPLSWSARSQGSVASQTVASKKICLPSPPPEDSSSFTRRRLDHPHPRSWSDDQRHSNLQGFGAWCEPAPMPPGDSMISEFSNLEEKARSERLGSLGRMPGAPREPLLPPPELSPMSTHYVFCPCCGDEDDRINDTWRMAGKEKMNAQLDYATAYISQMQSRRERR